MIEDNSGGKLRDAIIRYFKSLDNLSEKNHQICRHLREFHSKI